MASEQHVAVYGQKRIPVPDGWTQEQVKAQMARFFPELADPKIESRKDGDKTEWVFSKKAGTKGADNAAAPGASAPDRRHARIQAELRGEISERAGWLSHEALLNGELGPIYARHLCAVLEPGTERFLGTAVAILLRQPDPDHQP